jgi:hypothetical protein
MAFTEQGVAMLCSVPKGFMKHSSPFRRWSSTASSRTSPRKRPSSTPCVRQPERRWPCSKSAAAALIADGITGKIDVNLGFPLDWRQAALAAIQPAGSRREIEILQQALSKLLILRPNPRGMEKESKAEAARPDLCLNNLSSWYRSLAQEQEWTDALRDSLQQVWPDFKSFRLADVGMNVKALQLRFQGADGKDAGVLLFDQLSDGEKALVGLYMVSTALATGAAQTVLMDEPDNYVGLPELQPWVLSLRELLDEKHQAIIISHHPEILSNAGEDFGRYLWRDNHTSPTRIGPLTVPAGLTAGEAVARGWIRA